MIEPSGREEEGVEARGGGQRKGRILGKLCQRKGREQSRQENLFCRKRRETPQFYLER